MKSICFTLLFRHFGFPFGRGESNFSRNLESLSDLPNFFASLLPLFLEDLEIKGLRKQGAKPSGIAANSRRGQVKNRARTRQTCPRKFAPAPDG